jgi:hypothetical protein
VTAARPLLAATLIVRDESANLPDCLASLGGLVDEVVVYDTGSVDDTLATARSAGARVLRGHWDGDFARARNAVLGMTRAHWVLSVDADERLDGDPDAIRGLLLGALPHEPPIAAVDGFLLQVTHLAGGGQEPTLQMATRLFRPDLQRWQGRVHEILVPSTAAHGSARCLLPPWIARLDHLGYIDADVVRRKAERNLELAQAELDDLVAARSDDREAAGRVLYDLARSFLALGRRQECVDALETLRDLVPDGVHRATATAMLAQVLLDAEGFAEVALVLEQDLRGGGLTDPRLADWIRAQALGALGDPAGALDLLRGIDGMVDPVGTPQPMGRVLRARAVLAAGCDRTDEAGRALLTAMAGHGSVRGNGPLLLELYQGREQDLLDALRATGGPHLTAVSVELASAGPEGVALSRRIGLVDAGAGWA